MSIRHGLLALLERNVTHGYQLRAEFEASTGGTWPLNVGQVYTTLARLERDGLVVNLGVDDEGRGRYAITDLGRRELEEWFASAVELANRPRDELVIKIALAATLPNLDVSQILQTQRTATLRTLQDLTRLKRASGDEGSDVSWSLVLESLLFHADAELRWLDHCERTLLGPAAPGTAGRARAPAEPVRADVGDAVSR
jgi:DNA-binding PadR family transcriptional regulator